MLILLCLVIAIIVSSMFIPHPFVVAYKKRLLNIPDKSKIRSKEVSRFTTGLRYQLGHTILTTTLNFLMFVCGFILMYSGILNILERFLWVIPEVQPWVFTGISCYSVCNILFFRISASRISLGILLQ
ncbi:MAG: hypothetical protein PARBA_00008 [Parabacteroides sp.]